LFEDLNGDIEVFKADQVAISKRLEKRRDGDRTLAMARSKDGSKRYPAVLEYIKSFNEVEREMYERIEKKTRNKNNNETSQGIFVRAQISGKFR
jgi:hypothetical protein